MEWPLCCAGTRAAAATGSAQPAPLRRPSAAPSLTPPLPCCCRSPFPSPPPAQTVDVQAKFVNGKPDKIECKYVMRSSFEWDRFMR